MIFNLYNYLKIFNDEVLPMNDEIEIWESVGVYNGVDYGDDYEISTLYKYEWIQADCIIA